MCENAIGISHYRFSFSSTTFALMGVLAFVYFMLTVLLVGDIYYTPHCSLIFLNYLAF